MLGIHCIRTESPDWIRQTNEGLHLATFHLLYLATLGVGGQKRRTSKKSFPLFLFLCCFGPCLYLHWWIQASPPLFSTRKGPFRPQKQALNKKALEKNSLINIFRHFLLVAITFCTFLKTENPEQFLRAKMQSWSVSGGVSSVLTQKFCTKHGKSESWMHPKVSRGDRGRKMKTNVAFPGENCKQKLKVDFYAERSWKYKSYSKLKLFSEMHFSQMFSFGIKIPFLLQWLWFKSEPTKE